MKASEISSATQTTVYPSPNDQATLDTVTAVKNFLTTIMNLPFGHLSDPSTNIQNAIDLCQTVLASLSINKNILKLKTISINHALNLYHQLQH